jgi:peptidoglycan/LPS O-acetylase OafA/YrhL
VAALLIVLNHARNLTLQALGLDLDKQPAWIKAALVPTLLGAAGVGLLLVLSGYLVGGSVVRQLRGNRFDPVDFGIKRVSRFWSVLIPAVAVTWLIDIGVRAAHPMGGEGLGKVQSDSARTVLCNVGLLQSSRCSPLGSNASLWSLSYEFWFYVLFAGAAFAAAGFARRRWLAAIGGLVVAAAAVAIFGPKLLSLLPAWLYGVVVSMLPHRAPRRAGWWIAAAILGVTGYTLVSAAAKMTATQDVGTLYLLIGFFAAPLVWLLAAANPDPSRLVKPFRFFAWLGNWSFSICAFHMPLLMILTLTVTQHLRGSAPLLFTFGYGSAFIAILGIYPLYLVSERHLPTWRRVMMRLLRPGSSPEAHRVSSSAH